MKRNLLILLAVLLIASVTLGAGGGIRITGEIEAIGDDAMTITVDSTIIYITDDTEITLASGECVPIDFEDLEIGQFVRVSAVFHGDLLIAKRIIAYQ